MRNCLKGWNTFFSLQKKKKTTHSNWMSTRAQQSSANFKCMVNDFWCSKQIKTLRRHEIRLKKKLNKQSVKVIEREEFFLFLSANSDGRDSRMLTFLLRINLKKLILSKWYDYIS